MNELDVLDYTLSEWSNVRVVNVDVLREGGTRVISCSNGDKFYLDRYGTDIYTEYPIREDVKLKDGVFKYCLLSRVESYYEILCYESELCKSIIKNNDYRK